MKSTLFKMILLFYLTAQVHAIEVRIPDVSAPAEKTFTLAIQTSDLNNTNIFSVDMKIIFDPSILSATTVSSSGALMRSWGNPTFNIASDNVRISGGGTTALSGAGTLVKIRFRVANNATAGSISPLAFAAFQFNEGSPPANLTNGTLTVVVDSEPPALTRGPAAESITTHSATISWRTDEPSNSVVEYGSTAAYGQTRSIDELVTNHAVSLTGLAASSIYHFRVASTDKLGNGPVQSGDNTFTTLDITISLPDVALDPGSSLSVPVSISDISKQGITSFELSVVYDADILSAIGVSTGGSLTAAWPSPSFSTSPGRIQLTASGPTALSGAGILLYLQLQIYPDAPVGRQSALNFEKFQLNNGSPPVVTRNGSFWVTDTRPPEITSGPAVVNITTKGAEVVWTTDEKASSRVDFGKTSAYGNTEKSSSRVFDHRISLSGLDPGSTYHYRISSSDSSGNGPSRSEDFVFSTKPAEGRLVQLPDNSAVVGESISLPLVVGDVTGAGILSYHAVIQYDRTVLEFLRADNGSIASAWPDFNFDSVDGQVLLDNSGASPLNGEGTLCNLFFRVRSESRDGNSDITFAQFFFNSGWPQATTQSGTISISGNPDTRVPEFTFGPAIDKISPSSSRLHWYSNEAARAEVEFGTSRALGEVIAKNEFSTHQSIDLNGLEAATRYYLRVNLVDEAGNGPRSSRIISFETLGQNGVAVALPSLHQAAGSTFQLSIDGGNLSGLEVYSIYIVLAFDDQLLTATGATSSGTLSAGWGNPVYTITPGRIVIAMGGVNPLRNSGSLVKINFSVRPAAQEGSQTPIYFEQFSFNEGTPAASLTTGSLLIRDSTAPTIEKGPIVFGLTQNSASILWSTNEQTTALVEYGETSNYGEEKERAQLSSGHLVILSGLEPSTLYHFRTSSTDAAGNGPVRSSDQSFTTPGERTISLTLPAVAEAPGAELLVPVNIGEITGMGIMGVDFDIRFDPQVLKALNPEPAGTLSEGWKPPAMTASAGLLSVSLRGETALSGSGTLIAIRFFVLAEARIGARGPIEISNVLINGIGRPVDISNGTFTVRDNSPPMIINGPFASSISTNSAEIVWYTDEPANSLVSYGLTQQYDKEVTDDRFVTEHSVTLDGLATNTQYNYRVASSDSFGNGPTVSDNGQLQTLGPGRPIVISLPDTALAEQNEFLLPVVLENDLAESITSVSFEIFYNREVLQLNGLQVDNSLAKKWGDLLYTRRESSYRVDLSGNEAISSGGTLIYISGKVNAAAPAGATSSLIMSGLTVNGGQLPVTGENGSIRIIDLQPPRFVKQPYLVDALFNSAVLSWESDEPTTGRVEYGPDQSYGYQLLSDTLSSRHTVTLSPLQANTAYHYRVAITDSSLNGPVVSEDRSFTTPPADLVLSMPDTSVFPNQNFILPIQTSRVDGFNLTKIQLSVRYDPKVLAARGATNQNTLTSDWRQPSFSDNGGVIQLEIEGAAPVAGKGTLLYLLFQASPAALVGEQTGIILGETQLNNGSLLLTGVNNSTVTIAAGDSLSAVRVFLPDTTILASSAFRLPISIDSLRGNSITSFRFKLDYEPLYLRVTGIDTSGTLAAGWTITDREISDNSFRCEITGTPPLSGPGALLFLQVESHDLLVPVTSSLLFDYFIFNNGFPPATAGNGSVRIKLPRDIISGIVLEKESGAPVDSALVTLNPGNRTTLSDSSGFFQFTGLDTLLSYNLLVAKKSFVELAVSEPVRPGTSNLKIWLEAKNGLLQGKVSNTRGNPIAKALIVVDDGFGNFGSTNSDSSGNFGISGLATSNPYTVRISKYGYFDRILENVPVNSTLNIVLEDDFGRISGTVSFAANSAAANIQLLLTSLGDPLERAVAYTDMSGNFSFEAVTAGDYILVVEAAGFMSEPEQHIINLGPGQREQVSFFLEAAILHSLTIQVNDELPNNKESNLFYLAQTESGRKMSIQMPEWQVLPAKAGEVRENTFLPNPSFLGVAAIIVTDRATLLADTAGVDIYAPVAPETGATYSNESGIQIAVQPGSFAESQKLKISSVLLPPFKQNARSATAVGEGIQLKPDGYVLGSPVIIKVPYQTGPGQGLVIGRWDKETANWLPAQRSDFDPDTKYLSASLSTLGLYSVLVRSKPLGIESLRFAPNPFSPDLDSDNDGEPGLAILLTASSRGSRTPFVTIKIYNMLGDLVKTLAERKPVTKDRENRIRWDGRTNDNRLARNGRYLVHTTLEDASGKTEKIDTVVLIR